MNLTESLFMCVRASLGENKISSENEIFASDEALSKVLKLASKHDIAHLVALGILNSESANEQVKAQLQKQAVLAFYRYEKLNYELQTVCETLEKANIPFIPLKGSVLREYYPEPWMRTSCDIDVLVHEEDLQVATKCLIDNLNYVEHRKYSHDMSLFSPSGVHFELHYDLVEDGWANSSCKVLSNVWDYASLREGKEYWYELSDSMFYFYHIAHMAKHFQQGGCGIRPFIDLWILDRIKDVNLSERNELLIKGELLQFADAARNLSKVWLDNAPIDSTSEKMENYIFTGGVYGTIENKIAVQQQKKGGSVKYAISKIILTYDELKFHYPILQKHKWLFPFMQVRRWFKLVFGGHAKRTMQELSYNKNISQNNADEMKELLKEIGL